MMPSQSLMKLCRKQLAAQRRQTRGANSPRHWTDLLQYALSNEESAILALARSGESSLDAWWLEIQEELELELRTIDEIAISRTWLAEKVESRFADYDYPVRAGSVGPPPRPEQAAFRQRLLRAYGAACALTGVTIDLEAAHVHADSDGGSYETTNGILLCRAVHLQFDRYRLTFDATGMCHVKPDRDPVCSYAGLCLRRPLHPRDGVTLAALAWHHRRCRSWFS